MPELDMKRLRAVTDQPLTPLAAEDAVLALGGLAAWWLSADTLATARSVADPELNKLLGPDDSPKLSAALGSCWVVCAVNGTFPLLRSAVVLPLQWKKGEPHSAALPPMLRALANQVIEQVKAIRDLPSVGEWGLHPHARLGLNRTPLADDLFRTLDSGWAALAGGLIAAILDEKPKTDVWASAAWRRETRLTRVDGLATKLTAAVAFAAKTFYVHWEQVGEAKEWVRENSLDSLIIEPIGDPTKTKEFDVLRTFVSALVDEPDPPDANAANEARQFEKCGNYYLTLVPFSERATRFYASHLLEAIIRKYRTCFRKAYPTLAVRRFVTIVSGSPELASMAAAALDAEQVLLLHTGGSMATAAGKCAERLGVDRCTPAAFTEAEAVADIRRLVAEFTAGVPEAEVVLDLKPGTKKMAYAMLATAQPGNHMLNLEPVFRPDRRNTPGTEIPELLPAIGCHPTPPSA